MIAPRPLILILENDVRSAAALSLLLNDWGYDAILVADVVDLGPLVGGRTQQVHAVIADFHLGNGTGLEAVAHLKDAGLCAPTLFLTGSVGGSARRSAAAAGYEFLDKPAKPARLKDWLERNLNGGEVFG